MIKKAHLVEMRFLDVSNCLKSDYIVLDFGTFSTMTSDYDYDRFHIRWSGHSHCHKSLSLCQK
jgi:hypothetical protein